MAKSALDEEKDKLNKVAKGKKEAEEAQEKAEKGLAIWKRRGESFIKSQRKQLAIDQAGAFSAQFTTEFTNWLIRLAADWGGDESWVGRNADLLQSIPHAVLGSALYVAELLLREPQMAPSGWNQYGATFGLIWQHLGLNNVWNAVRGRMGEGKEARETTQAELQAARQELAALRAKMGGK